MKLPNESSAMYFTRKARELLPYEDGVLFTKLMADLVSALIKEKKESN